MIRCPYCAFECRSAYPARERQLVKGHCRKVHPALAAPTTSEIDRLTAPRLLSI